MDWIDYLLGTDRSIPGGSQALLVPRTLAAGDLFPPREPPWDLLTSRRNLPSSTAGKPGQKRATTTTKTAPAAKTTAPAPAGQGVQAWVPTVAPLAQEYGVPMDVALGIMDIESGGDPNARSKAGAMGLMQVMCVTEDTEALTKRGWLFIEDIEATDEFLTYNLSNDCLEWNTQSSPLNSALAPQVVHIANRTLDFVVTPNHKWVVYDGASGLKRDAVSLKRKKYLRETAHLGKAPRYILRTAKYSWSSEAVYSDSFVALVGWVITDGRVPLVGKGFNVVQSKPDNVVKLRELFCEEFPGHLERPHYGGARRWSVSGEDGMRMRAVVGVGKRLPLDFLLKLTEHQAQILLDAMVDGDGCRHDGRVIFNSPDHEMFGDFQTLCFLLGKTCVMRTIQWRNKRPYYSGNVSDKCGSLIRPLRMTPIVGSHAVWCPSLPNQTFVVRRAGTISITGNSGNFAPGENGMDPETNIRRGLKMLADRFARFGNWESAAASYFGAIGADGKPSNARDVNGVSGVQYVQQFKAARERYANPWP